VENCRLKDKQNAILCSRNQDLRYDVSPDSLQVSQRKANVGVFARCVSAL
jgi:hypothetical protein